MNRFGLVYPSGATPLDRNELDGLIPDFITTQGELNALERENILEATAWAFGRKHSDVLNTTFALNLHKRMLNHVWNWAGTQRTTDKNLGVPWSHISTSLGQLFGDARYWIAHATYEWDEIGTRFHHRLVSVHVFANGNGRHARLMTDVLLRAHDQDVFSWGMRTSTDILEVEGTVRRAYISALKHADRGQYDALQQFVRS